MRYWHIPYLGLHAVPAELTQFELNTFFTFSPEERAVISARRLRLHQLGIALQIGFIRMAGRPLSAFEVVPTALWAHLGKTLDVPAPEIASLRVLYQRRPTLFEHQNLALEATGFARMSENQQEALVSYLRKEVLSEFDRNRLATQAKVWLYENNRIIESERPLRSAIDAALVQAETVLADRIRSELSSETLQRWREALESKHPTGVSLQQWLWNAPRKQSVGELKEQFTRVARLTDLGVAAYPLNSLSDHVKRHYASCLAGRPPSAGRRIKEPRRTIEVTCFMQVALLTATDTLVAMTRQRIADLWNEAARSVAATEGERAKSLAWLVKTVRELALDESINEYSLREQILHSVAQVGGGKSVTRAHLTRERLVDHGRSIRPLLARLCELPFESLTPHPVLQGLNALRAVYLTRKRELPADINIDLGKVWVDLFAIEDRKRALQAFEVATLLGLRRGLKCGSIHIAHSFIYRSRETMLISADDWKVKQAHFHAKLKLPRDPKEFTQPILEAVEQRLKVLDEAVQSGEVTVDSEVHIGAIKAVPEADEVGSLRNALFEAIGQIQLPEVILDVDSKVRFSWALLGREPGSVEELLLVYAGLLAHGTALSAMDTSRMVPSLAPEAIRQSMRWLEQETQVREANAMVFEYMHSHPIAQHWGRADLASSDMMSLETSRNMWSARADPRRKTKSYGMYTHVWDRWGIFYDQPIVLNERQAGVALEGVIRQTSVEISQLAVDTHGYTDFAMLLSKMLGFDLCPRLRDIRQRKLYVPSQMSVPESLKGVVVRSVRLEKLEAMWDEFVRLAASVQVGKSSAVDALFRFGAAARGEPFYDAGAQGGRLLRTLFLCDWYTNPDFRRELQHVLNRGESVHVLQRTLHTGKIPQHQARQTPQLKGTSSSLTLLSNIVMAWTTAHMQQAVDSLVAPASALVTSDNLRHVAPIHSENINCRGQFLFPFDRYAARLLPSMRQRGPTLRSVA